MAGDGRVLRPGPGQVTHRDGVGRPWPRSGADDVSEFVERSGSIDFARLDGGAKFPLNAALREGVGNVGGRGG